MHPRPRLRLLPLLLLATLLAACGGGGGAGEEAGAPALGGAPTATLVVTNHADAGPGSLRQAILDAPSGAWIVFDDVLPAGTIALSSTLEVDKILTIGGLDGGGLRHAIDGQSVHQIFSVVGGGLQLNDFELHHGATATGGAIQALFSDLVLWRTHVHDCGATNAGGAIFVDGGSLGIFDCFFSNNQSAGVSGAIHAGASTTRIERTSFFMNQGDGSGGALALTGGSATIVNSAFHANTSLFVAGGAIYAGAHAGTSPVALALFNCTITDNTANSAGGGVSVHSEDGVPVDLVMHRCIVAENHAATDRDTVGNGTINASGSRNLIGVGSGMYFHGLEGNIVGDGFAPRDPELVAAGPLPDGRIVRFPIPGGVSVNAVPAATNLSPDGLPMVVDLRFLPRLLGQPSDLGAIEL